MKRILVALACLNTLSAFAAGGESCPISSGSMVTTFVGVINDGTQDQFASDGRFYLRVASASAIKFTDGLTELAVDQELKFATSTQDAKGYCLATQLEASPASLQNDDGSDEQDADGP